MRVNINKWYAFFIWFVLSILMFKFNNIWVIAIQGLSFLLFAMTMFKEMRKDDI